MNTKQFNTILKGVILFLFGLVDTILLIRLLLKLIGAGLESSFVRFWYGISQPFYNPFAGTFTDISSGTIVVEINSIIALLCYFILALCFLRIIHGIFRDKISEKLRSFIDTGFKIIEIVLSLRLIFKLLGASTSGFITFLYAISWPFYEPFKGLLKSIGSGNIVFETSTFVAIVIIIILDYISDRLLTEVFKQMSKNESPSSQIGHSSPQQNTPFVPVQSYTPQTPMYPPQQSQTVSSPSLPGQPNTTTYNPLPPTQGNQYRQQQTEVNQSTPSTTQQTQTEGNNAVIAPYPPASN
jgi:hypothetical protein